MVYYGAILNYLMPLLRLRAMVFDVVFQVENNQNVLIVFGRISFQVPPIWLQHSVFCEIMRRIVDGPSIIPIIFP